MKDNRLKILIADDHPLFVKGIRAILDQSENIVVIAEAKDGVEAIEMVELHVPDIVIMDITMPNMDGIEATKEIVKFNPDSKVLALSIHSGKRFVKAMLEAGAVAYLLKDSAPDELLIALEKIANGEMYLSSAITSIALGKEDDEDDLKFEHSILQTKLHRPSVMGDHIERKRLVEHLQKNINKPFSLISAPPGYGKSVLASQWLEKSPALHTWISLEEEDNDLRIFLLYFIAAIDGIVPGALNKTRAYTKATTLPPNRILSNSIINELDQIQQDFILVLDDYHKIHLEDIHQIMDDLLNFPPQHMHLTLITRRDPPLNLNNHRTHNRMTEIRMQDLAFTEDEVFALLESIQTAKNNADNARLLFNKTEGWIVGLRLATLALDMEEDADDLLTRSGSDIYSVTEFLIEEVLSRQSVAMRELLMVSSLFNRFCKKLLEHLRFNLLPEYTKEDPDFFDWLIKSNLFLINLDYQNKWFRYHHLFGELLQKQHEKFNEPDQLKKIYGIAAEWFLDQDLIEEAIQNKIASGDMTGAASIVENRRISELESDQWHRLEDWLDMIPAEIQDQRPQLLLARAWIYYQQTKIFEVVGILVQLSDIFKSDEPEAEILGEMNFFLGMLAYFEGDGEKSSEYIEKSLEQISDKNGLIRGEVELLQGFAWQMCGQEEKGFDFLNNCISRSSMSDQMYLTRVIGGLAFMQMLSGDLAHTKEAVQRMHSVAKDSGSIYARSWSEYIQGWAHFQAYNSSEALAWFNSATEGRYISEMTISVNAFVGMILSYQSLHKYDEANKAMSQLLDYSTEMNDPQCLSMARSCQARLAVLQGDLELASQWAKTMTEPPDPLSLFFWIDAPSVTKARVLIAENTPDSLNDAVELLKTILTLIRQVHFRNQEMDILVLLSVALYKLELFDDALLTLEKAIKLAGPRGWIRPFMEAGPPMPEMLEKLKDRDIAVDFIHSRLDKLESSLEKPEIKAPQNANEQRRTFTMSANASDDIILTLREQEVVDLLALGLRNKEIAGKLYVSEVTIKKHLSNIFSKLDVKNRVTLLRKLRESEQKP